MYICYLPTPSMIIIIMQLTITKQPEMQHAYYNNFVAILKFNYLQSIEHAKQIPTHVHTP